MLPLFHKNTAEYVDTTYIGRVPPIIREVYQKKKKERKKKIKSIKTSKNNEWFGLVFQDKNLSSNHLSKATEVFFFFFFLNLKLDIY